MPFLIIQSGKHRGKKLVLPQGEISVGRDEDCQIRLATSDVSRRHCTLRIVPEGFFVKDLESRNGTFVNEVPAVEEMRLKTGDMLRIGPVKFRVGDVDSPGSKRSPKPAAAKSGRRAAEEATTEEDVVSWLAEMGEGEPEPGGDTTEMKSVAEDRPKPPAPKPPAPKPQPAARRQAMVPPPRKQFDSLAEEAADIIRRYKEQAVIPESDAGGSRE